MKIISTIILLFFVAIPIVFGFGGQTKMRIDEIYNNTGDNIILKPSNKVGIDYLTGDKIIQSTAEGLLEESTVTTTELGYLSGVTSSVQDQISSKQDSITGTDGDLYYWNSGLSNLTIGTEGQFLKVSSLGFPEWVDLPTAVSVTTKGDLQTYSTQADRLPVGTDGQVLQANSATSTGLEWVDADFYTSPLTTEGDLLYRDATQDTRLPIGTEDQVLTVNASGLPVWADSKGGGGSAGINFVVDPSFEKNDLAFTNSLSGTTTYPLYTADDKLYSEFNEAYFQIAHTGLSAANYSTSYTVSRTGLDGKQGLVSIWAKTAAELDLCVDVDTNGCDTTLTLINDDTWRKYEVPIVFGSGNVLLKFVNASITGNVTLQLDNVYVGTMPDGYIQDVGQAHFVGRLILNNNCQYRTVSTSFAKMLDTDSTCSANSELSNITLPTNTNEAGLKILNPRTDGYYEVQYHGFLYNAGNSGTCKYFISETSINNNSGTTLVASASGGSREQNYLKADIKLSTTSDGNIYIWGLSSAGTNCDVYGSSNNASISVHFYPDDKSTIVTQNTELTAKTANEFSALILSNGTVIQENYDWIDGNCVEGANPFPMTCTYKSGLVSNPMNCQATISYGNTSAYIAKINSSTSTAVEFQRSLINGNGDGALNAFLHCSKQGADVNKSATIVGKFENINSSDLCQLEVRGRNSDQAVTGNSTKIIWDTNEVKDNCNLWDGDEYTASKTGRVSINGMAQFFGATATRIDLYVNETTFVKSCSDDIAASNVRNFNCQIDLNAGDVLSFKSSATRTYASGGEVFNHLSIQEMPDYEAIVKNLSDQAVKCQTKYPSTDILGNGFVAELQFSNLVVGKKYRLTGKMGVSEESTLSNNKEFNASIYYNSTTIDYSSLQHSYSSSIYHREEIPVNLLFTNTGSTIQFNVTNSNNTELDGGLKRTYLQLCELPDTYVETTEF